MHAFRGVVFSDVAAMFKILIVFFLAEHVLEVVNFLDVVLLWVCGLAEPLRACFLSRLC
jgi:hypothetical protein